MKGLVWIAEASSNLRCLSSLSLHLVDPRSVDVHRSSVEHKVFLIQDLLHQWAQQLPEDILAPLPSCVVDHHLDHCWVARHNLQDLINL